MAYHENLVPDMTVAGLVYEFGSSLVAPFYKVIVVRPGLDGKKVRERVIKRGGFVRGDHNGPDLYVYQLHGNKISIYAGPQHFVRGRGYIDGWHVEVMVPGIVVNPHTKLQTVKRVRRKFYHRLKAAAQVLRL